MKSPMFLRRRSLALLVMTCTFSLVACGGGGGSGGTDVVFAGTITRSSTTTTTGASTEVTTTTTTLRGPQCSASGEDIEVCSFSSCSQSSSEGKWSFSVDEFGGGDVDFFVSGCGVNAVVRVIDLNADARRVEMTLSVVDENTVTYSNLVQSTESNPVDTEDTATTP